MAARPAIPNTTRFAILKRDNFTCQYCGATPSDGAKLVIDHIYPVALGGKNEESNYVTACSKCNSAKFDWVLTDENDVGLYNGYAYGLTPDAIKTIHEIAKRECLTFFDTSRSLVRWYFECIDGIRKPHNHYLDKIVNSGMTIIEMWQAISDEFTRQNKEELLKEFQRNHAQTIFDDYTRKRIKESSKQIEVSESQLLTMFFDIIWVVSYGEVRNGR